MSAQDESVDERQERLGRNEALFRVVNERIYELNEAFDAIADEGFEIVCECAAIACVEQILIPTAEYARVRTDPTLFVLVPGHEDLTVEAVVEENQAYLVVRKYHDRAAGIAAERAPD
jgi:hypothetical protein